MSLARSVPQPRTLVLAMLIATGLALRVWGLTFGLPNVYARPDELFLIGKAIEFLGGNPNPKFFDYPTLYMYALAGVFYLYYLRGAVAGWFGSIEDFVAGWKTNFVPLFLTGRAMAAVLGTATIGVVHAIAAPLFGTSAGLLSALFMTVAFLHVRDSHYATTDAPMAFFIMCAMLAIVRVYRHRRASDARLAGFLAALAMGTKYNAVMLAAPMIVVEVLHAWPLRHDWRRVLRETHLFRMAIPFILLFLAGSPYLILDHRTALEHLRMLQESTTTGMTPPELLGRGWTYHLPHSLWYGLGWPLLFSGLAGMVWMAARQPALAAVLASFPIAYYVVAGGGYNVFVRYMIPVVPFLCIFAGYLVAEVARAVASRGRAPQPVVAAMLGIVVAMPSAVSAVRFDRLLTQEDSRLIAGRWIDERVSAGASMFLSGNRYGHANVDFLRYRLFEFDHRAKAFTERRRPTSELPEWIVVQRSELPYSHVPDVVERLLSTDYELVHTVRAYAPGADNFYDIQDGFYLPFGGFRRVVRPGPNIQIYRRRS